MSWSKKIIFYAVAVCVPSLLLVICAEWILQKGLDLGDPVIYDAHPLWGYAPRANASYSRFEGDVVTINDAGLRGINSWKESRGKKLLFLGDSLTYGGSYIDDEKTFAHRVCEGLSGWVCHNGGVNAYGVLNMVARSRYDKRIETPDTVVFTVLGGDFTRGLQKDITAHFILREPPSLFPAIWEILNFLTAKASHSRWFGKKTDLVLNDAEEDYRREITEKFALDVLELEFNRLKSRGIPVFIVHSFGIDDLQGLDARVKNLMALLESRFGDAYYPLYNELRSAYDNGGKGLFRDAVHYEEAGHDLAARLIRSKLNDVLVDDS